jgi:hypothetical protein
LDKGLLVRPLEGRLGKQVLVMARGEGSGGEAWDLRIDDDYPLRRGYSGSPVLDERGQKVLAIVSHKIDEGKKGIAISVRALQLIWSKLPENIFGSDSDRWMHPAPYQAKLRMNLEQEIACFEEIATRQDTRTRLILLEGPTGMGKTFLLGEYERIATRHRIQVLRFPLGQQISIEECLSQVVFRVDPSRFARYDEILTQGRPYPLTKEGEEEWHRTLTHRFLMDLAQFTDQSSLAIFFDQLEKADRSFRVWLSRVLLPRVFTVRALLIVVSGQEPIHPKPIDSPHKSFFLNGVTVDSFQGYAMERRVSLGTKEIASFHRILRGEPKRFVEYVDSLAAEGVGS